MLLSMSISQRTVAIFLVHRLSNKDVQMYCTRINLYKIKYNKPPMWSVYTVHTGGLLFVCFMVVVVVVCCYCFFVFFCFFCLFVCLFVLFLFVNNASLDKK